MTASVRIGKGFCLTELNYRLVFHDAELTDSIIKMDFCVSHCQSRHKPLVVVSGIAFINNSHVVRLNNAEILEGRAAWNHVSFIAFRQLHGNTEGD